MKYVFIEKHLAEFSIKAMCRVLRAARSGWYVWRARRHQLNHRNSSGSPVMRYKWRSGGVSARKMLPFIPTVEVSTVQRTIRRC